MSIEEQTAAIASKEKTPFVVGIDLFVENVQKKNE